MSIRFEGHVQGVGFRYTVVRCAGSCDVTGFVKNEMDRSVSVVAEGSEDELNRLLQGIRSSSVGRFIVKEYMSWSPATGQFSSFDVSYGP